MWIMQADRKGDCLRGGNGWCVVRWNRGGSSAPPVCDVTASLLGARYVGGK
ncbi:hypothetical protein RHOER0001_6235 [Rhodococcus erythropolis SK121]|nr:hypothetical protein RHOER0001_6235 [Rhodococcus erythropolis SK121]